MLNLSFCFFGLLLVKFYTFHVYNLISGGEEKIRRRREQQCLSKSTLMSFRNRECSRFFRYFEREKKTNQTMTELTSERRDGVCASG